MKLTNMQIYDIALALIKEFKDLDTYIPAKANFFIQKNINTLNAAAQEIEEARQKIAQHYGTEDPETHKVSFSGDNAAAANQELQALFSLEQDIDIKTFSIESLGDTQFTPAQMQALMIMIEG